MTKPVKIVVFTGNLSYSVRKGIAEIAARLPETSWLILAHAPRRAPARLLKSQWRNLRRHGWRFIPYQAGEVARRVFGGRAARLPAAAPGGGYEIAALEARPNVRVLHAPDLHASDVLGAVQAFGPDLGLSLAAPILREPLFSLPRLGTLNLHKGKVPAYRGMPPAFWELWNDEGAVGCTVHWVDARLDTGDVVGEATVERAAFSTLRGLQLQLDELGVELTCEAVGRVLAGTAGRRPQSGAGKTNRKPTLTQIGTLRRKLRERHGPHPSRTVEALKDARSIAGFASWRLGLGRVLTPRITVLLYHRVSDDVRDNLTVGIEQFDRQMALLRERCEPLSIEQVLESRIVPRSSRPLVAVTFDDGYLDNYANAASILVRNGVPAAFFVSTGLVNTAGRFPHDVRRGNQPIPLMTWDQLRKMRDWGFTIGSHSVSHIDCAAEPEEKVRFELAQSRDDLRRELGVTEALFAYPYGGRQNMTPERLALVKEAGYLGCLSAYGGTNVATVDPFNVLRQGIHWEFSDRSFLFECLGLR